jgi:hypothetical protein
MIRLIEFIPQAVEGVHDKLAIIDLLQNMMLLAEAVDRSS